MLSLCQCRPPVHQLYYGDNLQVLQEYIRDESVDLIYLDPPFNSKRLYNVFLDAEAQATAFDDTWTWNEETEADLNWATRKGPPALVTLLCAYREVIDSSSAAYLVMMAARLLELRRVLKPTGSIYLHCDPTASCQLREVMNVIFGKENFQNEIIWKRTSAHNDAKKWGPVHDTILYYVKSKNFTWNQQYTKYDQKYIDQNYRYKDNEGRLFRMGDLTASGLSGGGYEYDWKGHTKIWRYPLDGMRELENEGRLVYSSTGLANYKRYLDEMSGVPISDVITDISPIGSQAAERLGYPTQKPIALLERIISASSQPGDLILDPFCGCGTAIQAAEKLERQWIGIDVTRLAISLIERRLAEGFRHVDLKWEVIGVPKDINAARDLALRDKCQFQFWACSLVQAWPYDRKIKKGADKGIDGVKFFYDDNAKPKKIIISVKGGDNVNPGMVRDLHGVIEREKAALGLFITLAKPTRPMKEAAMSAGFYEISTNNSYRDTPIPRIQLVRVEDLLRGRGPKLPPDYASGRGTFRHNRAVGEATEKNPIF